MILSIQPKNLMKQRIVLLKNPTHVPLTTVIMEKMDVQIIIVSMFHFRLKIILKKVFIQIACQRLEGEMKLCIFNKNTICAYLCLSD